MSAIAADSAHEFTMNDISGKATPLKSFASKAVLFVNVASQCGYTPQYRGLEALYREYKDQGLVIVGVPANNFGSQEPGSNEEIATFRKRTYDVTFPMMAKVEVKGANMAPLYSYLTQKGGEVEWNFTKFLLGKDGKIVERFEPGVSPDDAQLVAAIEKALQ